MLKPDCHAAFIALGLELLVVLILAIMAGTGSGHDNIALVGGLGIAGIGAFLVVVAKTNFR